jgi:hypothetical protein
MLAELGLVDPDRVERFMRGYFDGRHSGWLTWLMRTSRGGALCAMPRLAPSGMALASG